jgi:ABC-type branched-subunit amino acid transport system substrate-binding protein
VTRSGLKAALLLGALVVGVGIPPTLASAATNRANPSQGVTSSSVTFGFISPQTGAQSAVFPGAVAGCKAAIGLQNAKGGVNGRKVKVIFGDDQSNFTGMNTTIAMHMVQDQNVFLVVNDSGAAFQTYTALEGAGVPMIDYGGNAYEGEPANENFVIPTSGNTNTNANTTYNIDLKIMKAMGAKKIAAVGFATAFSPGSHDQVVNIEKYAPKQGLQGVYLNDSLGVSTADLGPVILGIKNSGADGLVVAMSVADTLPLIQGLEQAGVKMKSVVGEQGYGQPLLAKSVAATLGPEDVFQSQYEPISLKTPATKTFVTALKKYGDLTGIPDYGAYTAYQECDLAMLGIQHAGNPPKRAAFVPAIRALKTVNPGGLDCAPVDVSAQNYGKSPSQTCDWFAYVKDDHWVLSPKSGAAWVASILPGTTPANTLFRSPTPSVPIVK